MIESVKKCSMCRQILPSSEFHKSSKVKSGVQSHCKYCIKDYQRNWKHKTGRQRPYTEAKDCSSYFGVHVAERLLSTVFIHVFKMPYGYSGYDFICGKGFKVDVKCSTLKKRLGLGNDFWMFSVDRNRSPDYFAFVAFDNRTQLTPLHFWIVPENIVNGRTGVSITDTPEVLSKWLQYEKPIDKLITDCNLLKVVV